MGIIVPTFKKWLQLLPKIGIIALGGEQMDVIKTITNITNEKNLIKLVKHNKLIQSKYTLESSEQKLLYKIFEHIQKSNYTTREFKINLDNFFNEFRGILGKNITKNDFIKLVIGLQDNIPYILVGDEFIRTQWFKIKGKINHEEIKLILDDDIFQYVQSLNKEFTGLRLESLYGLKGFYSMRIYELIRQWINTKQSILYDLDSFKELLGLEGKKSYDNFGNFERKILKKSVEEINEKSELDITYTTVKKGKKVIAINFIVSENKDWLKFEPKTIKQPTREKNTIKKKPLRFANYEQRDIDHDSIEKAFVDHGEVVHRNISDTFKNIVGRTEE